MADGAGFGEQLSEGLKQLSGLVPERVARTRGYRLLGRLAQHAVDGPAALERLKHACSAHALRPLPFLRRPRGEVDLSAEATVFVTTVGRSTCPAVLAALEAQDCRFRGPELIAHVSPWPRAFGRMVARCQTPYLVQVDEDMVLKPYAVRYLVEQLRAAPPEVAMVVAPLWDSHLRRTIQGVKVWRHAVLAQFPKQNSAAPSIDLVARLEASGHRIETLRPTDYLGRELLDDPNREEVLGEHRVEGKRLLFDRFYSVFSTYQRYPSMDAAGQDLGRFLERLDPDDPGDPNLWALLGAVSGLANPRAATDHYTAGAALPGYRQLLPLVLRGPEEVGLRFGDPTRPDAGLRELRRLLELYPRSIRAVRLLGRPLGRPGLAETVALVRERGLALTVEHPAGVPAAPAELAPLRGAPPAELCLVAEGAIDWATAAAARAAGLRVRLRVHVDRAWVLNPEPQQAFAKQLQRGRRAAHEVEILPPLPTTETSPDRLRARTLLADDPEVRSALAALRLRLEGVRWAPPLDPQADPACESPFRALVVDGAGNLSGCLAGVIPTAPEHGRLDGETAETLWFDRHLRALRNELSGKAECRAVCRHCPFNRQG